MAGTTRVASGPAGAPARTVVTRDFIVSYDARRLTVDLMTTGYVRPSEAASLEAAIDALIRDSRD